MTDTQDKQWNPLPWIGLLLHYKVVFWLRRRCPIIWKLAANLAYNTRWPLGVIGNTRHGKMKEAPAISEKYQRSTKATQKRERKTVAAHSFRGRNHEYWLKVLASQTALWYRDTHYLSPPACACFVCGNNVVHGLKDKLEVSESSTNAFVTKIKAKDRWRLSRTSIHPVVCKIQWMDIKRNSHILIFLYNIILLSL